MLQSLGRVWARSRAWMPEPCLRCTCGRANGPLELRHLVGAVSRGGIYNRWCDQQVSAGRDLNLTSLRIPNLDPLQSM